MNARTFCNSTALRVLIAIALGYALLVGFALLISLAGRGGS